MKIFLADYSVSVGGVLDQKAGGCVGSDIDAVFPKVKPDVWLFFFTPALGIPRSLTITLTLIGK